MNALLIAGTDTGVGKTVLTCALAAYWQTYAGGRSLGIFKPIQCGEGGAESRSDRRLYLRLFPLNQSLPEINPVFLEAPLAPAIAAQREQQRVDMEVLWQAFETLSRQKDWVLIESVGSLGSPLTPETTVADLAWDWHIPTVLVVPVRKGAIGQAVANAALAREAKMHLKGIILNSVQPCTDQEREDWVPIKLLQSLTALPVLGHIPHLSDPTDLSKLTQVASDLDLEMLMPWGMFEGWQG